MTTPSVPNLPQVDSTVLVGELVSQMEAQPWYKRFSNTVTTAAGLIVLTIWVAASAGYSIPTAVTAPVYAVLGVLTLIGVLKTRNGITPRGIETVETAAVDAAHKSL